MLVWLVSYHVVVESPEDGDNCMVPHDSVLVQLLALIDQLPLAPSAARRGRPCVYSERLFLKAVVVMIVRHLPTVYALLAVLAEPGMAAVRDALSEAGCFPTRRTWERRLKAVPERLPAQIALVGERLLALLDPWADGSRAVAIDSTVLAARGGVWHKKDRAAGVVPHTSIDTEAHWTKSGWHGWVYGWKLHLIVTVGSIWLPLAAELTPANVADNVEAVLLLDALREAALFVLGDMGYSDPDLVTHCAQRQRTLVTTRRAAYPHRDDGVEVRRLFHQLRSHAIENFNGQFKAIFDCARPVPTKGLVATQRHLLGAVLVYQLALLYRFQTGGSLRAGLKPLLQAA
ncbi:MAG: transposase [Acidimicrobiales bacterium]|nr:transposase [Acidimicrobiales bacterium]